MPRKLAVCFRCERAVHTFCLNPPRVHLPAPRWVCAACRRAPLPFKKEARLVRHSALTAFPDLCSTRYVSALADAVAALPPPARPVHPPGDHTVVLRVRGHDSDLDHPSPRRGRGRDASARGRSKEEEEEEEDADDVDDVVDDDDDENNTQPVSPSLTPVKPLFLHRADNLSPTAALVDPAVIRMQDANEYEHILSQSERLPNPPSPPSAPEVASPPPAPASKPVPEPVSKPTSPSSPDAPTPPKPEPAVEPMTEPVPPEPDARLLRRSRRSPSYRRLRPRSPEVSLTAPRAKPTHAVGASSSDVAGVSPDDEEEDSSDADSPSGSEFEADDASLDEITPNRAPRRPTLQRAAKARTGVQPPVFKRSRLRSKVKRLKDAMLEKNRVQVPGKPRSTTTGRFIKRRASKNAPKGRRIATRSARLTSEVDSMPDSSDEEEAKLPEIEPVVESGAESVAEPSSSDSGKSDEDGIASVALPVITRDPDLPQPQSAEAVAMESESPAQDVDMRPEEEVFVVESDDIEQPDAPTYASDTDDDIPIAQFTYQPKERIASPNRQSSLTTSEKPQEPVGEASPSDLPIADENEIIVVDDTPSSDGTKQLSGGTECLDESINQPSDPEVSIVEVRKTNTVHRLPPVVPDPLPDAMETARRVHRWGGTEMDPKQEALFTFAVGQKSQSKASEQNAKKLGPVDAEATLRLARLRSRADAAHDMSRHRLQMDALAASRRMRQASNLPIMELKGALATKGSIDCLIQQNSPRVYEEGSTTNLPPGASRAGMEQQVIVDAVVSGAGGPNGLVTAGSRAAAPVSGTAANSVFLSPPNAPTLSMSSASPVPVHLPAAANVPISASGRVLAQPFPHPRIASVRTSTPEHLRNVPVPVPVTAPIPVSTPIPVTAPISANMPPRGISSNMYTAKHTGRMGEMSARAIAPEPQRRLDEDQAFNGALRRFNEVTNGFRRSAVGNALPTAPPVPMAPRAAMVPRAPAMHDPVSETIEPVGMSSTAPISDRRGSSDMDVATLGPLSTLKKRRRKRALVGPVNISGQIAQARIGSSRDGVHSSGMSSLMPSSSSTEIPLASGALPPAGAAPLLTMRTNNPGGKAIMATPMTPAQTQSLRRGVTNKSPTSSRSVHKKQTVMEPNVNRKCYELPSDAGGRVPAAAPSVRGPVAMAHSGNGAAMVDGRGLQGQMQAGSSSAGVGAHLGGIGNWDKVHGNDSLPTGVQVPRRVSASELFPGRGAGQEGPPVNSRMGGTEIFTDRQNRRTLMPFLSTAARRAQYEQGRAMAFVNHNQVAPGGGRLEGRRAEDVSPGYATRPGLSPHVEEFLRREGRVAEARGLGDGSGSLEQLRDGPFVYDGGQVRNEGVEGNGGRRLSYRDDTLAPIMQQMDEQRRLERMSMGIAMRSSGQASIAMNDDVPGSIRSIAGSNSLGLAGSSARNIVDAHVSRRSMGAASGRGIGSVRGGTLRRPKNTTVFADAGVPPMGANGGRNAAAMLPGGGGMMNNGIGGRGMERGRNAGMQKSNGREGGSNEQGVGVGSSMHHHVISPRKNAYANANLGHAGLDARIVSDGVGVSVGGVDQSHASNLPLVARFDHGGFDANLDSAVVGGSGGGGHGSTSHGSNEIEMNERDGGAVERSGDGNEAADSQALPSIRTHPALSPFLS